MDEERERYVEEFAVLFEQYGQPRMVGRVWGRLMVADPPELTAGELAVSLRASRGSISGATRTLVAFGLVERVSRSGERRDYFRVKPGAWDDALRRDLEAAVTLRQMAERGLDLVGPEEAGPRRNLGEMLEFYTYRERELAAMLERWRAEKERSDVGGGSPDGGPDGGPDKDLR